MADVLGTVQLASADRRLAAYALDALLAGIVAIPFLLGMRLTGDWSGNHFDQVSFYAWGIPMWLMVMVGVICLEGTKGATPGKWLLGMRVIDVQSGDVIGWRRDTVRRLMFLPEAIPLWAGFGCSGIGAAKPGTTMSRSHWSFALYRDRLRHFRLLSRSRGVLGTSKTGAAQRVFL